MVWLIVIIIVLLAIFKPLFLISTVLKIAAPFFALWIIIKLIKLIFSAARDWDLNPFHWIDIDFGDIHLDLFNKKHYTYNEGSHNQYITNTHPDGDIGKPAIANRIIQSTGGFTDHVDENRFEQIVLVCARKYKKRMVVHCEHYEVIGIVTSQSRLNEWTFRIKYNTYSNDARYTVYSENDDSKIPSALALEIQRAIRVYILESVPDVV